LGIIKRNDGCEGEAPIIALIRLSPRIANDQKNLRTLRPSRLVFGFATLGEKISSQTGTPAAPEKSSLVLLPFGPGTVQRFPPRRTHL